MQTMLSELASKLKVITVSLVNKLLLYIVLYYLLLFVIILQIIL